VGRASILIVDDDEAFGRASVDKLVRAGFSARFHRGPFGCLNAIRETDCGLVLLDVSMPKLDGAMVLRLIRQTFAPRRIPVLLFSNMERPYLSRLAASIGADGAISKNADEAELSAQIRAAMAESLRPAHLGQR
jgi:DNA-binding response OmpR family regulator